MCLFTYFIVCTGYFKFVYEFFFLIYLVIGHMHSLFYFIFPQIIVFIYLFVHILEK